MGNFWKNVYFISIMAVLVILAGCQPLQNGKKPDKIGDSVKPTEYRLGVTPAVAPKIMRYSFGKSVENRPILGFFCDFPSTEKKRDVIFIFASIHGDETVGTPLLNRLYQHMEKNKQHNDFKNKFIILLPEINPDGLAKRTRNNANNVDINHDFASENPQSETRIIKYMVEQYKPNRIISLRQLGYIDYDAPSNLMEKAESLARHILKYCERIRIQNDPTTVGSLGWYGEQKGIPVITLGFPRFISKNENTVWELFGNAIISSIFFPKDIPQDIILTSTKIPEPKPSDLTAEEEDVAKTFLQKGISYYEKKEYGNAVRELNKSVKSKKYRQKGVEYLHKSYYDWGIEEYNSHNWLSARKYFLQSEKFNRKCNDCKKYIQKCDEMLKKDKDKIPHPDIEEKDISSPENDEEDLLKLQNLYFENALLVFKSGDYSLAQQEFQKIPNCDQDDNCKDYIAKCQQAEKAVNEGIASLKEKQYDKAANLFKTVLTINPDDKKASGHLFEALYQSGIKFCDNVKYKEAKSRFDKAKSIKYCPDCDSRLTECEEKQYKETIKLLSDANMLYSGNKKNEAIKLIETAIQKLQELPDNPKYKDTIGKAKEHKERIEREL